MDKIETLCQTVDSLAGAISRFIGDLSKVEARIEAIEQRQAKLAVEQVQTGDDETKDWDTLANMLGMETVAWMVGFVGEINMYGFEDDGKAERNLKAMLIGLACLECNGLTQFIIDDEGDPNDGGDYEWAFYDDYGRLGGEGWDHAETLPAAAIAMLKACRGEE